MYLRFMRSAFLAFIVLAGVPVYAGETGAQVVDAQWVKAMKANDIEAAVRLYAADAVAWFPNAPGARGEKAIRAVYEGLLSANSVKDAVPSDTSYKTVGNLSTGWGSFILTLAPKAGGEPVVLKGRFTEVAVKRGGKWVYLVDHASADPPPETGAKP